MDKNNNSNNDIFNKENEESQKEAFLGNLFSDDKSNSKTEKELNNLSSRKDLYNNNNSNIYGNNIMKGETNASVLDNDSYVHGRRKRVSKKNSNEWKNSLKKFNIKRIVLVVFLILALIVIISIAKYKSSLKPIDKNSTETVKVNIEKGDTLNVAATKLNKAGAIKSDKMAKIYIKLHKLSKIKKGRYKIPKSKSVPEILEMLKNGETNNKDITITLVEGKTFLDLANIIAKKTNHTVDEVISIAKDKDYLKQLSQKYWFINYDKVTNPQIYYPLEGYLFPDTYILDGKDAPVKSLFTMMLKEMESKLEPFKDYKNKKLDVDKLLTLASLSELEAKNPEGRKLVATIFANRLVNKMSLGSDVTTYYAEQIKMSERDLTLKELRRENPYNTRGPNMEGKLPIGPICMPSESSIKAAINIATDYVPTKDLYFVADKNGKIYTAKTYKEHNQIIDDLKSKNLWFVYDK